MINHNEMIGKKFHRWTVLEYSGVLKGYHYYLCRCDCNKIKVINRKHLLSGNSKSCGCYNAKYNYTEKRL